MEVCTGSGSRRQGAPLATPLERPRDRGQGRELDLELPGLDVHPDRAALDVVVDVGVGDADGLSHGPVLHGAHGGGGEHGGEDEVVDGRHDDDAEVVGGRQLDERVGCPPGLEGGAERRQI